MIDVLHNPDVDAYVLAVRDSLNFGRLAARDLRTTCPECGVEPSEVPEVASDHRLAGPYVVVGCEGYYVVNPNLVGIPSPGWEPAS